MDYSYKAIPILDLVNGNLEDKDARHLMVIGKSDSIVNLLNYQLRKNPVFYHLWKEQNKIKEIKNLHLHYFDLKIEVSNQ